MEPQRAVGGAVLGAIVSIVGGFLPFVSFAAPLLGGLVAGYVHRAGLRGGAESGAVMGVLLALRGAAIYILGPVLPAFPAAVVLGPWARVRPRDVGQYGRDHRRDDHTYTAKIDRLGGFNLRVELPPQQEIPEDEYREVFRQLFADVGLPPEVIDDLTFEYTPTVW